MGAEGEKRGRRREVYTCKKCVCAMRIRTSVDDGAIVLLIIDAIVLLEVIEVGVRVCVLYDASTMREVLLLRRRLQLRIRGGGGTRWKSTRVRLGPTADIPHQCVNAVHPDAP